MPKFLLQRCGNESVRSFRDAAAARFADGTAAALGGRRTAAIYLWGYAAEMVVKAAYFTAYGFSETRVIQLGDLTNARNLAISPLYNIHWPNSGKYHNIRAWCDFLVAFRSRPPAYPYKVPHFGTDVERCGLDIEPLWRETLRYHRNVAYTHEVDRMRRAVSWLLENSLDL